MNQETKTCQNCQKEFTIEPEDFEFYDKIKVPPPTFCPECRLQRRLAWRNEKTLYKRKCDATEKEIFSMFHKNSPVKVYDRDYWWSDNWNPMDYGRDYDWSRSFFEQFRELMHEVPWFSRSTQKNIINSDYCMNCADLKNCYLVFNAGSNENCYYSVGIERCKDCMDNLYLDSCELCYGCFRCSKCYYAIFSSECENSNNIYFSKDLRGCSDCFGCVSLRNKRYYIFNKPYLQEDYLRQLKNFNLESYTKAVCLYNKFQESIIKFPNKYFHGSHNINVSGDYIYNSKNVINSFFIEDAENCKHCYGLISKPGVKDCYDYSIWGDGTELIYDSCQVGINSSRLKFNIFSFSSCQNLEYCIMCPISNENLFACVGLHNKQYCILNKQYTKEEYEALVPKIIEHMNSMPYVDKKGRVYKYGEFFPVELSPFSYNETVAQEYFPLSKKEVEEKGYSWKDQEERTLEPDISWKGLPDHIKDVKDDIISKAILCQAWDEDSEKASQHNCTKLYKIIPQELEFYRKMNLPLPRLCPNCRHYQRIKQRNPLKLWHRKCQCAGNHSDNKVYQNTIEHPHHKQEHCPNEFETSYASEKPEIVYCEKCYLAEVV